MGTNKVLKRRSLFPRPPQSQDNEISKVLVKISWKSHLKFNFLKLIKRGGGKEGGGEEARLVIEI
jgi:hypothetical protein